MSFVFIIKIIRRRRRVNKATTTIPKHQVVSTLSLVLFGCFFILFRLFCLYRASSTAKLNRSDIRHIGENEKFQRGKNSFIVSTVKYKRAAALTLLVVFVVSLFRDAFLLPPSLPPPASAYLRLCSPRLIIVVKFLLIRHAEWVNWDYIFHPVSSTHSTDNIIIRSRLSSFMWICDVLKIIFLLFFPSFPPNSTHFVNDTP